VHLHCFYIEVSRKKEYSNEMKPSSKKHHYIPRFYLDGFTDSDGFFFVYDKLNKKIWRTTPANAFAENHRNTGRMQHFETREEYVTDLPEEMLAYYDGQAASAIINVRNSTPDQFVLTDERLLAIRFFILSVFWRTPVNDELRESIISNFSFEDLGFGIFDEDTGERHKEVEDSLKEIDLWRKIYTTLLPTTSFTDKYKKLNGSDWKLYYKRMDFHITTDNPILFYKYTDFASLHEEVIFPLSSKILLVSSKKYKPHILAPLFNWKIDQLLFHKAGRYVASSRKEYLNLLIEDANKIRSPYWAENIKEEIYNYFY
jgi:hypothetical protein